MNELPYTLQPGNAALLVSLPHVGHEIPPELHDRYVPRALRSEDTDWHLSQLYDFVRELNASLIVPRYSRYVIDLNRPPDDTPMYPGASNTELCPTRFFTGEPLYHDGCAPDAAEVDRRRRLYWQPYHDALRAELDRLVQRFGHVVLFDGHSIQSQLPWLFEGKLPDLNLGTADGKSCAPSLRDALQRVLAGQHDCTWVVDGRFKGGYITRHYGAPQHRVHAVQLEKCQCLYMNEQRGDGATFAYDTAAAQRLQPLLRQLVATMAAWRSDVA